MNRISNYHSHIKLCGHATGDVVDYVKEAIKHNYKEIGISDHAPIPVHFVGKEIHENYWLSRMMTRDEFFNDYLKQFDDVINEYGDKIKIYKGLEIEYLPDHDPFYQKLFSHLDYLNLGIHYFDYNGGFSSTYNPLNDEEMERYCEICEEALSKGWFSCLVHPDLYLYHVKEFTKFHEKIARRLIEAAIKNDCYIEINGNGGEKYPRREFWEIAKEYKDVKILINSDAHCVENFHGKNIERVMKFASDLGLNVCETMDLKPHKHETLFVGHRGASDTYCVNNTLSGFKEGIKRDYYALECDVRVSLDGIYYIHHDSKLTYTNNNFICDEVKSLGLNLDESLDNLSWDKLSKLNLYYLYRGTTIKDKLIKFEDYIKLCKDNHTDCVVELKQTNGINDNDLSKLDGVFDIIKKYDYMDHVIIISFMKKALEYVKENYKVKEIQYLTGENTNMDSVNYCIKNNFSIDSYYPLVTKEIVDMMHKHNLKVNIWTLNEITKLDQFKEMEVDYITTDNFYK